MKKTRLFIGLLAFAGFALTAQAQKAYEGFEGYDLTPDSIADEANGWATGWSGLTYEQEVIIEDAHFFDKPTGKALQLTSQAGLSRDLIPGAWPDAAGASYWIGYTLQLNTPEEDINEGHNGALYIPGSNGAIFYFGLKYQDGTSGQETWSELTAPNWAWHDFALDVVTGEPVYLVARLDMSGDEGAETAYLWINPDTTLNDLDIETADIVDYNVGGLNNGLEKVNINANGGLGEMSLQYDEIRLGTTFADVNLRTTPVGLTSNSASELSLSNSPNPFSGVTTVSYTLPEDQDVKVSVYDAMGKEVSVLAEGKQAAGKHELTFSSEGLAAGLYICKLQAGSTVVTKSMMVK